MQPRQPGVIAIIQARMGSSRLPGKVLMDIAGKPMLIREVVRARRAQTIGQVVVATSVAPEDTPVEHVCRAYGVPCFRGDLMDVLDRYYQAAVLFGAETVVRLTGDCPLIDPGEIDRTVRSFFAAEVDFAANRLPPPWKRTTPIGMDTEVVSASNLAHAWRKAESRHAREHVMPFFYSPETSNEHQFSTLLVDYEPDLGRYRLTVDTPEDLTLVRAIYDHFEGADDFSLADVIAFLDIKPELMALNAQIVHKGYRDTDDRLIER